MDTQFFTQFTSLLDENWFKRLKSFATIISKLTTIKEVTSQPQVIKVASQSKNIKNFLSVLEDASTFNITKMNPDGLLVRTLNSNKSLSTFLTKNASMIEKSINYFKKLSDKIPGFSVFTQKFSKFFKVSGYSLLAVDFGYKYYKNYQSTKSVTKGFIGTIIDSIQDFNIVDGIAYGSFLGPKGMIVGASIGAGVQFFNVIAPKFFDESKKWLYSVYDNYIKPKPKSVIFQVDREIVQQRIRFYEELVSKLEKTIEVIRRFSNQFNELATGKTATTITRVSLEKLITKCSDLLNEHIKQTYQDLLKFNQDTSNVFYFDQQLHYMYRPSVCVDIDDWKTLISTLDKNIQNCEMMMSQLNASEHNDLRVVATQKIKTALLDLNSQKFKARQLIQSVEAVERNKYYE